MEWTESDQYNMLMSAALTELPSVGRRTADILNRAGFTTLGDLHNADYTTVRDSVHRVISELTPSSFDTSYWLRMQRRCEGIALRARNAQAAPTVPEACMCPITWDWIVDPVRTPSGHVYDRSAILTHIREYGTDPMTRSPLTEQDLRDDPSTAELITFIRNNFVRFYVPHVPVW